MVVFCGGGVSCVLVVFRVVWWVFACLVAFGVVSWCFNVSRDLLMFRLVYVRISFVLALFWRCFVWFGVVLYGFV